MKLLEVSKVDQTKLPWARSTIRQYHSKRMYPKIIIRIGGKLFFDEDAFYDLAEKKRDLQVNSAK